MTDKQADKGGDSHGVGGMTGKETVLASAIASDNINGIHKLGIVGRTESGNHWFEYRRSHLVGYRYAKSKGDDDAEERQQIVVANEQVNQYQSQRQPR